MKDGHALILFGLPIVGIDSGFVRFTAILMIGVEVYQEIKT
jgi:hypothetical protein